MLGAAACLALIAHHSPARRVALVFERYGTSVGIDLKRQQMAFLLFTNSSDSRYCLPMIGGANSFRQDSPTGYGNASYLVEGRFGNLTNSIPKNSLPTGPFLLVLPHSAMRIRVPLPQRGEKRKLAVLCFEAPSASRINFWTAGAGKWIFRALPGSVVNKWILPRPEMFQVWSDCELSRPDGIITN